MSLLSGHKNRFLLFHAFNAPPCLKPVGPHGDERAKGDHPTASPQPADHRVHIHFESRRLVFAEIGEDQIKVFLPGGQQINFGNRLVLAFIEFFFRMAGPDPFPVEFDA